MENIQSILNSDWLNALPLVSWLKAALYLMVGYVVGKSGASLFERMASHRLTLHRLKVFKRLIFYFFLVLFAISAMRELGFKLSVLLGAAGIFTVAIGFASQTSASNLISGLFLLGENSLQIGDLIETEGVSGEIVSIDLLSIKIRTFDNRLVRIPNETIIKSKLINNSRLPIRRIDLPVGVAYREDVVRVRQILLDIADRHAQCLEYPEPLCVLTGFGDSSVNFQLSVWTKNAELLNFKHDMLEKIKQEFDRQGIEIPFPHVSLYAGSESSPIRVVLESPSTRN